MSIKDQSILYLQSFKSLHPDHEDIYTSLLYPALQELDLMNLSQVQRQGCGSFSETIRKTIVFSFVRDSSELTYIRFLGHEMTKLFFYSKNYHFCLNFIKTNLLVVFIQNYRFNLKRLFSFQNDCFYFKTIVFISKRSFFILKAIILFKMIKKDRI